MPRSWTRPPRPRRRSFSIGDVTRFLDVFEGMTIRRWLVAVVTTVAVGTTGFVVLGWPLDDALYMTVITMTTVGFKEVRELDGIGRAWTMTMAVAGVAVLSCRSGSRSRRSCRRRSVADGRRIG